MTLENAKNKKAAAQARALADLLKTIGEPATVVEKAELLLQEWPGTEIARAVVCVEDCVRNYAAWMAAGL